MSNTSHSVTPITPIAAFYQRETEQASQLCFVQPYADGRIEELSWHEVGRQVRCMVSYLQSLELETGSRIAILSSNCAHWIMADLAIWIAGHVSVPLYSVLTAKSIRQILDHSEAELVFIGKLDNWSSMQGGIPDDTRVVTLPIHPQELSCQASWHDLVAANAPIGGKPDRDLDDLATIVYTSGTTGLPKGVMHSFRTIAMTGTLSSQMYASGPSDRVLSYLPLAHVAERAMVEVGMLYRGFRVYFAVSLDTFADDLKRASPTLFFAVPRIWLKFQQKVLEQLPAKKMERLLKLPIISSMVRKKVTTALGMQHVRIGLSGAAPLSTSTLAWYHSLRIPILEGYGMTENFAYSHTTLEGQSVIGTVGCVNPEVDCKISEQGEVLMKSPTIMLGYYKEPGITAQTINNEGYLRTGDKGVIDDNGYLKLTGRIKEIFKTSKGKYVAPAPIEDMLSANQAIEQVCVTGADFPQPLALVQLSEIALEELHAQGEEVKTQIQESLKDTLLATNQLLDKHENLACLVVLSKPWTIENGLITPTLKIKRAQIEQQHIDDFEKWFTSRQLVIWE